MPLQDAAARQPAARCSSRSCSPTCAARAHRRRELEPAVDARNYRWVQQRRRPVECARPGGLLGGERAAAGISHDRERAPDAAAAARSSTWCSATGWPRCRCSSRPAATQQRRAGAPTMPRPLGSSSAYSTVVQGYRVTAVGEVPPQTVRAIAQSIRTAGRQPSGDAGHGHPRTPALTPMQPSIFDGPSPARPAALPRPRLDGGRAASASRPAVGAGAAALGSAAFGAAGSPVGIERVRRECARCLTLLTRAECGLCEQMLQALRRCARACAAAARAARRGLRPAAAAPLRPEDSGAAARWRRRCAARGSTPAELLRAAAATDLGRDGLTAIIRAPRLPRARKPSRCSASATSPSSRTSTTANRRSPTASSSSAAASRRARWRRRCSTRWTSSASAASPSRRRPSALHYTARDGETLPAQPDRHARATSTSPTRCRARSRPAKARCWWSTPRRASRRRRVANCYTAIEQGVEVVPVLNKIDLPSADPERVITEIEDIIGIDAARRGARAAPRPARASTEHARGGHRAHSAADAAIRRRRCRR